MDNGSVQTGVYRKKTNNSIFIHWNSYSPKKWKIGTLSGMIRRAYVICSNKEELDKELAHLKKVFTTINGYPHSLVTSMMTKIKDQQHQEMNESQVAENGQTPDDDKGDEQKLLMLKVPYAGEKGETIIKDLNNTLKRNLRENINCRIAQTGTKLSQNFNVKDKVDGKHLSNFVYRHTCKNKKCDESYIGETARRRVIRTEEHGGRDKQSWIFKHSSTTKHPKAKDENFEVLATNYADRRRRKLAEAMFIRDEKPSLNVQRDSYKLVLFN